MKKNILHSNIEILSNNLSKNCHQVKHGIYFVITSHEIPKKKRKEEANNINKIIILAKSKMNWVSYFECLNTVRFYPYCTYQKKKEAWWGTKLCFLRKQFLWCALWISQRMKNLNAYNRCQTMHGHWLDHSNWIGYQLVECSFLDPRCSSNSKNNTDTLLLHINNKQEARSKNQFYYSYY